MKSWQLGVGVALWFIACLGGLYLMANTQMQPFDPDMRLNTAIADSRFSINMVEQFTRAGLDVRSSIIHLTDEQCVCSQLASRHRAEIDNKLQSDGFESIHLPVNSAVELRALIPSVPALAIFDDASQLIYFGPYSSGLGCLGTRGPVDGIIAKLKRSNDFQPLYISEASGCYCPNKMI